MDEGADPNARTPNQSAVWIVVGASGVENGCLASLQVLVDAGGTVDRRENGWSILGIALSGHVEPGMVSYLGDVGADPCAPLEQQVNLQEAFDDGESRPTSLHVYAQLFSSTDGVSELEQISVGCP